MTKEHRMMELLTEMQGMIYKLRLWEFEIAMQRSEKSKHNEIINFIRANFVPKQKPLVDEKLKEEFNSKLMYYELCTRAVCIAAQHNDNERCNEEIENMKHGDNDLWEFINQNYVSRNNLRRHIVLEEDILHSGLDGKHEDAWDLWDGIRGRLSQLFNK